MSHAHPFRSKARSLVGIRANATTLILALGVSLTTSGPASAQQTPQALFQQTCFSPGNTPSAPASDPANPAPVTTYSYANATSAQPYAATRYPIILLTGGLGSPNGGENNSQYFYAIPQTLAYYGATACVPNISGVDADGGPDGRGAELAAYLQQLRVYFNDPTLKFNLIGHSEGGYTARVVENTNPDMVASVTTIGTPHQGDVIGIPLVATGLIPAFLSAPFQTLENQVIASGILSSMYPGATFDAMGLLQEGGPAGIVMLNTQYPSNGLGNYATCTTGAPTDTKSDANGTYTIPLFSWAGNAEQNVNPLGADAPPIEGDASVSGPNDPIYSKDNTTAETEVSGLAIMTAMYAAAPASETGLFPSLFPYPYPLTTPANDGAVDVCSAKFGTFLGTYPFNHLNEVNREEGMMGANALAADPLNLFLQHAHRLATYGTGL